MKSRKNTKFVLLSLILILITLVFIIVKHESFTAFADLVLRILRPVTIGLVLAYLCNPIFRLLETKAFAWIRHFTLRRSLSLLFTYIVMALIVVILLMLIIPQLLTSILDFLNNYEVLLSTAMDNLNNIIDNLNHAMNLEIGHIKPETLQQGLDWIVQNVDVESFIDRLLNISNFTILFFYIEETFYIITDTIFGLFISLYLLASKEKQYAQVMRLRRAIFNDRINERLTNICTVADRSFGGFLRGKILDSTIVGILVYIIISIMGVPYALLISVLIGITDIVPVIGPFIGVIPSAIIILLTDPIKVIPFLLCILIVQQIDGNVIAPKILGENTGVSSLCVMIAITVMGALWGLAGMVLGVPLFATIIELGKEFLNKRLRAKGLPVDAEENHSEKNKKRRKKEVANLADGRGSLTVDEKNLLLAYSLVRKHDLWGIPDPQQSATCVAEYRAAVEEKDPLPAQDAAQEPSETVDSCPDEASAAPNEA